MKNRALHLLRAVLSLCLASLLLAGCALPRAAAEEPRAITSPQEAEAFVRTLFGEHPESLDGAWLLTEQMEKALQGMGGFAGAARSLAALGAAEQIGPAYAEKSSFRVPCRFSAMPLDIVLTLSDGALAGLTTAFYTGSANEAAGDFDSVDLSVPVPALNGELPGTLTLPRGEGPFPAVVLVHGSGPSDRDESVGNLYPFRDIAQGLAERGVAVFRYDKRTYVYGVQMAANRQATLMDETVDDAVAAVQTAAAQEKIDPSRIFVLGHSLGATAIPAIDGALQGAPVQARGYILMAPGARRLDVMMREQYDFLFSLMPEITEEAQAQKDQLFRELDRLEDLDALSESDLIAGAYAPYWQWLADYDMLKAAGEITIPCLLLQGEEDYQVTMEDYELWRQAVGGRENWTFIAYPGLTHPFVPGEKAEGANVYAKDEKVAPQVIGDIADFILK